MKNVWLIATGIAFFSTSCQEEANFAVKKTEKLEITEDLEAIPEKAITVQQTEESTIALHAYGKTDVPVDYLFIMDNSSSMADVVEQTNQGFSSLVQEATFPPNSQVAVMTTMIADPNDFSAISSYQSAYAEIEDEPGFLDFVDKDSIQKYRNTNSSSAMNFQLDGCDKKWFSPSDLNDRGMPCLTAATQIALRGVGAEAGITAYEQLILKHKETPLFREGALLNVIFVSDTHDPGKNVPELIAGRKNYAQLDALTKSYQKISSLKFHAMAPAVKCASEQLYDFSYFEIADDSQGVKADVCTSTTFVDFLEKMVAASTVQEPQFELTKKATEVISVLVDGEEAEGYSLSDDGLSIRIEGLDPQMPVAITLEYR